MINHLIKSSRFWITISIIFLVAIILLLSKRMDRSLLIIDYVTVETEKDIQPITKELVVPILYSNVQILSHLSAEKRKKRFIDVMLPAVLIYRHRLNQKIRRLEILRDRTSYSMDWSAEDSLFVNGCYETYKAKNVNQVITKMRPPPVSLCLAQAALESGWGSSRFFKQANNVFGIWSFDKEEDRILASGGRNGKAVYLKKYKNLLGSVEDYHLLLASSDAYEDFRACIQRGNNVFELIWYLRLYSERRDQYVIMLRNVIVSSNLTQYDTYKLNPDFFDYPPENSSAF